MENIPKEDKDFTTKNAFKVISETYAYILYSSDCPFTTHNITLCFIFKNKMDVCLLNRNVEGEHNFFNIGKFVLIITASYTDWAINLKHPDDANYFNFGQRRDLLNGNVEYSVMV
ncbi:11729_t:CDS:2 [Dentiscutata heterogama]|uniref:11729_t:CDS:1 n=1 Tax=Dentiscutata heterogama TaxID=1316150 RepID=A0ACA9MB70_9GLOM|nr:11729_t:CDS:2 [Dentiscutata heterogama]